MSDTPAMRPGHSAGTPAFTRRSAVAGATAAAGLAFFKRTAAGAAGFGEQTRYAVQAERTTGGELKVGLSNEPPNLDPHQASALIASTVMGNIFDTLLCESYDGQLFPGLATSWETSADELSVTLKLKTGITFHDGEPFNAAAVQYSFDRMVDPATQSGLAASLLGPYTGSQVVDDTTVVATFSKPFAPFLKNLARNYTAPISPKAGAQFGLDFATNPVGTGPFIFKEWVQKDHLTLERNPNYAWAPDFLGIQGPSSLDSITWRFVAEEATRLATLRNGESTIIESFPPAFVSQFQGDSDYAIDINANPGIPFSFMVNTINPPCDDIAVRQAMHYGLDKETISQTINFGVYPPAHAPLSPVTLGYWPDAETMYPFDPDQAKSILDAAGWVAVGDGMRAKDGVALKVQFWTLSDIVLYQNISQVFQAQMRDIGIDVEIVSLARAAWGEGVRSGQHHLTTQIFGLTDPSVLALNFDSANIPVDGGQGFNWSFYTNPDLDNLFAQGEAELNSDARVALYQQAQKIILDNAVMIPVYVLQQVYGRDTSLQGLVYITAGMPLMYTAFLAE